jgi:hypothetical protein
MKPASRVGLALVIWAFAVGPALPADASAALPEFEVTTGFVSVGTESFVLETPTGWKMTCNESESENGAFVAGAGKKATGIIFRLKKCSDTVPAECQNAGAGTEEVKTNAMSGEVGYIEPAVVGAATVAFALKAEAAGPIAAFKCGAFNLALTGCVISTLSPAEMLVRKFTMGFKQAAGVQEYVSFEPVKAVKQNCKLELEEAPEKIGAGIKTSHAVVTCPNMERIKD